MNINLNIQNTPIEPISATDYPVAGTGVQIGCLPLTPVQITSVKQLNAGSSSSSVFTNSFLRINSYSSCVLSDNTSLIAVASQNKSITTLPPSNDPIDLAYRESSQVHIIESPLGNYAASTRRAKIVAVDVSNNNCTQGVIDIEVNIDPAIYADPKIKYLWVLDGNLAGIKFNIVSRTAPNLWRILPANQTLTVDLTIDQCFKFIPYGDIASGYATALNHISPLPYIIVNGIPVGAVNPQIASNHMLAPNADKFVYVIAEAPVGGAYQLFFYSFRLGVAGDYDLFGWQQLTYDGENRNAKIKIDGHGNIHVTWESNRCKTGQIFYGIIGPSSREVMNETFVSVVDKWVEQNGTINPIAISAPTAMNLRQIDEYGVHHGNFWNAYNQNGGTTSIISDTAITVSGNAKTQKFAAFACLTRDQNDNYFDGLFSQLSYQIAFNLNVSASTQNFDKFDVANEYETFKQMFQPVERSQQQDVNVYKYGGKYYTINEPQLVYENIIPIVGAYKSTGMCAGIIPDALAQISLHHYMIAVVPEKLRLTAKSTQGLSDISEIYYTGKYKFAIVFETSANISDHRVGAQKHHWVRLFGKPTTFNAIHNYKIAVHYSHLRDDGVDSRVINETIIGTDNSVRFSGDIVIAIDGVPVLGETFVPDFSDLYHQFDLGFGCSTVGEFRTALLAPFSGSNNDSLPVTLNFTDIAVGPHSLVADPYNTFFAPTDRNVKTMVVKSDSNEYNSLTSAQEAWDTNSTYLLTLGMNRQKFGLSQVPITFLGTNSNPSIDVNACERPHIAYQSNRNGSFQIFYTGSVQKGLPFRTDTQITSANGQSLCPSIAVNNLGKRVITWHDNRTGQYQIFAARSNEKYTCDDGWCNETAITDLGTTEYPAGLKNFEYDPYIDSPYYGSSCPISFEFTNINATGNFHFRLNFYSDPNFTSFVADVDSRYNIGQWQANNAQIGFAGVQIPLKQTATITYYPSKNDGIFGQLLYVEIEVDNGTTLFPLQDTVLYFCPIDQLPVCTIPVIYSNETNAVQTVHFRVTVYRDPALTEPVLSASTQNDITRWISGVDSFPTSGISVPAHDTISVVYNPQFLALGQELYRDASAPTALLCNVTYYVTTEVFITGSGNLSMAFIHPTQPVQSPLPIHVADSDQPIISLSNVFVLLDSFALFCACEDVNSQIWRHDNSSNDWLCSAQVGMDMQITDTDSLALYPSVAASDDGIFYIAWEDRRLSPDNYTNDPNAYWAIWDSKSDVFYCSAQGYHDRLIGPFNLYHPLVLVNHMQNPAFVISNGNTISTRLCSLFAIAQISSSSSSSGYAQTGLYNEMQLPMDASCMNLSVYQPDVASLYHQNSDTPIALVDECQIRFEVVGPYGSYAVRFMNENETNWSPWLSVLPNLPYGSSSSATITSTLNGFSLSSNRFVVPWILSRGNGNKTVSCQILTPNGRSPTVTVNLIAIFRELTYTVNFFKDAGLTVPASNYNGTPVVSTNVISINANDVTSLAQSESTDPNVYIQIVFDDVTLLKRLLTISTVSLQPTTLSFNVYTQGFTQFNLPLNGSNGVYTGQFQIANDDGIDNVDGIAIISVNIPTPCSAMASSSSTCSPRITPSNIVTQIQSSIPVINLEPFRYAYNADLLCSFPSNTCFSSDPIYTEKLDDKAIDQPLPFTGSVQCTPITWVSPKIGEKGFFLVNGGMNAFDWAISSPVFSLDFSDSRIDYLQFSSSRLDDILILIREDENVTASTSTSVSTSSSTAYGTEVSPTVVNISVPQGSVIFQATDGHYCDAPSFCNNGSAEKVFSVSSTKIADVPAGTAINDGTGGISLFAGIPWAEGINEGNYTLLSSSSTGNYTNCLLTTFLVGVSKNELKARGFISSNGIMRFKFVHIPSGVGFANITVTCGASCFTTSSSSSSH